MHLIPSHTSLAMVWVDDSHYADVADTSPSDMPLPAIVHNVDRDRLQALVSWLHIAGLGIMNHNRGSGRRAVVILIELFSKRWKERCVHIMCYAARAKCE